MIDLKQKVQDLIDQETEFNKIAWLDHDHCDAIGYNENEIIRAINDNFEYIAMLNDTDPAYEITGDLCEAVINWIIENQDHCLKYIRSGFAYSPKNEYSIAGFSELEIEIPGWIKRRNSEAINKFTDLYVNGSDYGYINLDYDCIAIDFDLIDFDEITEDLKND